MQPIMIEIFSHVLRVLLLICGPVVLFVALASSLVSALQTVTNIHDTSLQYAVRFLTFLVVLYFFAPIFISQLTSLAEFLYSVR